jgi:hypothetical protein
MIPKYAEFVGDYYCSDRDYEVNFDKEEDQDF